MIIIGLTGQSGAGKTAVSRVFVNAGFHVINCDDVAHHIMKFVACKKAVLKTFGDVFLENGEINRKKLGKIVFADKEQLLKLNNITHPLITKKIKALIEKNKDKSVIILDAPTLFESGTDKLCDIILGVICPKSNSCACEMQILRIMERDNITREIAVARLASQNSEDFFKEHCDEIIENDNDLESLLAKAYLFAKRIKNKIKNQEVTNDGN